MKSKVVFFATLILICISYSCASNKVATVNSTMSCAEIDLGSLPLDQYIILGQVSGEGKITVKTGDISKEARRIANDIPSYNNSNVLGDNGHYGFIGTKTNTNMTVIEKAIALATYKMIQAAQLNGADTIAYVTTTTSVIPKSLSSLETESIITAKTTGIAIKLKADTGIILKEVPSDEQTYNEVDPKKLEIEKDTIEVNENSTIKDPVPLEATSEQTEETQTESEE